MSAERRMQRRGKRVSEMTPEEKAERKKAARRESHRALDDLYDDAELDDGYIIDICITAAAFEPPDNVAFKVRSCVLDENREEFARCLQEVVDDFTNPDKWEDLGGVVDQ